MSELVTKVGNWPDIQYHDSIGKDPQGRRHHSKSNMHIYYWSFLDKRLIAYMTIYDGIPESAHFQ